MDLIIAMSHVEFAKDLKQEFSKQGVNIVSIVTTEEDLIEELVSHPDIDGVLLKSDLAVKLGESRLEVLVDIIEGIRKEPQFKELVFTLLSDEKEGHPFLAEIVELGIYNIIVKGQVKFSISSIINTFESPRSFSSAAGYKNVNTSIPWRRNLNKSSAVNLNFDLTNPEVTTNNENKDEEPQENAFKRFFKKTSKALTRNTEADVETISTEDEQEQARIFNENERKLKPSIIPKQDNDSQVSESTKNNTSSIQSEKSAKNEWFEEKVNNRSLVIGTVVIGVAGVASSTGCTNTAINIAKYLSDKGYKVGLVECNRSMDFDRIHSLIEGESIQLKEANFNLKGVQHIKYREDININDVFTNFEYVVLDFGELRKSPFQQEFYRSHIKLASCSADEWKYYLIENFLFEYEITDLKFVVPSVTKKWIRDLQARLKDYEAYPIIASDSPYIISAESEEIYKSIFSKYFKATKKNNYLALVLTSFASIAITILIFTLLN